MTLPVDTTGPSVARWPGDWPGKDNRPARPAGLPWDLTWRLFAAVGLVVIAGAATMLVAVLLIAEPAFQAKLTEVQPPMSDQARPGRRSFRGRVPDRRRRLPNRASATGFGPEFDQLTTTFNTTARRLATPEQTRRRLLADLAHELRKPLSSIEAMMIEAMIEAVTDGTAQRRGDPGHADRTVAAVAPPRRRLSAVSRTLERQLNLNPVLVPLEDVVTGSVTAARPRFEAKGISLTDHGNPVGQVMAADTGEGFDPDHAAQVFNASTGATPPAPQRRRERHRAGHRQGHRHGPPRKAEGHSDGPGTGARFEITLPLAAHNR